MSPASAINLRNSYLRAAGPPSSPLKTRARSPMRSASFPTGHQSSASSVPSFSSSPASGSCNTATCRPRPWPNLHRRWSTPFQPKFSPQPHNRWSPQPKLNSATLTDVTYARLRRQPSGHEEECAVSCQKPYAIVSLAPGFATQFRHDAGAEKQAFSGVAFVQEWRASSSVM